MKFTIMSIVVLGTLALFNPSQDDFERYAQQRAQSIVSDQVRESTGFIGEMGASLMGTLVRKVAEGATERRNYGIASVYEIDLNGSRSGGGEWRYLGIGGQFFELERPAALDR